MNALLRRNAAMLTAAAACLVFAEFSAAQTPARPNIVLVMADDLGWGDVGYNGHPVLRTPQLDAMAAQGLRLDRFYAAAPVCSPTRGSCLTGRHPSRYGIAGANSGHLREGEVQLAEVLREQGYRTGHFGKWHLGTLTRTQRDSNRGGSRNLEHYAPPWERGFDICFSTEAKVPTWNPMLRPGTTDVAYGTAYWTGPDQQATNGLEGDDSRVIVDRVMPFVRDAVAAEQPFFAVVWFHAPHEPVIASPEQLAAYAEVKDEKARHYYGCVTELDAQLGRVRNLLRELEVADNTILWFCSDNGPEHRAGPGSAGGLRGRKRDLYEGGLRVPAIVEWPRGIAKPSVSAAPAGTVDILPTLLDVLDVEHPDLRPLDGVSLRPRFDGQKDGRNAALHFKSSGKLARIEEQLKLVRPRGRAPFELYDIVRDPGETEDLAADRPEAVQRMSEALEAWRDGCAKSATGVEYEAPAPDPDDYYVMRDTAALARCFRAFQGGEGRVAFLGGSITHNPGWRDLVCGALRRRFPQTRFDFINAGIPSFGSTPGAFRVERDAFTRGPVDLLLVEAAVNDATNGRTEVEQLRAMEGIVRRARQLHPDVDIVMLHFADPSKIEKIRAGVRPDVIHNHERVAAHYSIPSIDLAREVTERIDAGQFTWKDDFRGLHPSAFGQTIYARSVRRLFAAAFDGLVTAAGDRALPKPLDPRCYDRGTFLPLTNATLTNGARLDPNWRPTDGARSRPGFVDVPAIVADKAGATVQLRFRGRAIGILVNAGPDAARIEYRIDNGAARSLDLFTKWSGRLHLPWSYMLDAELKSGQHTLEIRALPSKPTRRRGGDALRIVEFFVNE